MKKPKGLGKPQLGARGVRCGLMGQPGTGKTEFVFAGIPKVAHLLAVDTEGRSQYYAPNAGFGFEVLESLVPDQVLDLLKYAEHLQHQGEKVVFAMDSFTPLWHHQQDVAESIGKTSFGTAKFNSWGPAKRPIKEVYKALFATTLDCVFTLRAKEKYEQDDRKNVKNLGYDVADFEKNFPYVLDLLLEMRLENKPPGVVLKPEDFYAVVRKTSGPAEGNPLPIGKKIVNSTFADIISMRLAGNLDRYPIPEDAGLQVALNTIKTGEQFWAWALEQVQMDRDVLRDALETKHGVLAVKVMPDCMRTVWAMRMEGDK